MDPVSASWIVTSAKQVLQLRRILGLAAKGFLTKRKTRARLALTVQEVMCLEKILSFRPGPG